MVVEKPVKNRFECEGDYCNLTQNKMIPAHLASIVVSLLNEFEPYKAYQRTIQLDRNNI
jgi:hypothetical protein